jgi:hypothetical protein
MPFRRALNDRADLLEQPWSGAHAQVNCYSSESAVIFEVIPQNADSFGETSTFQSLPPNIRNPFDAM